MGANKGQTAKNKNEVFLTRHHTAESPTGQGDVYDYYTLEKVEREHGLEKFPTMRNRLLVTLKGANDGSSLVFLATSRRKASASSLVSAITQRRPS